MNKIVINKNKLKEFLLDTLSSCKMHKVEITNAKFHHNTSYKDAPSIIKNGILSFRNYKELKKERITKEEEALYNDENHVNGIDQISLATDYYPDELYPDEDVFNPYESSSVDIRVDSSVKAYRNSTNYYNEFLTNGFVSPDDFKSIDVRLIKYSLDLRYSEEEKIINSVKYYNYLKEIASAMKDKKMNIPLREMSEEQCIALDVDKLIKASTLSLRK